MTLPIPDTLPLILYLSLTIAGVGLVWYGALTYLRQRNNTHISQPLNAMDAVASLLSPVWLALIVFILLGLVQLARDFSPALEGDKLRWHILAFLGLVTALGALISAPLAQIRVYTTERQTRTAEQGHITDRISKAVEQLGAEKTVKITGKDKDGNDKTIEETKPNIEVRIGGLLSLERISQDSVKYDKGRDHVRVMEIICAYVRENAPASGAQVSLRETYKKAEKLWKKDKERFEAGFCVEHKIEKQDLAHAMSNVSTRRWRSSLPRPRSDIAMALLIIGRREIECLQIEATIQKPYRLDLSHTNLQKTDLEHGRFQNASLFCARLDGAFLNDANFKSANLNGASLIAANGNRTCFDLTKLSSTNFEAAILDEASFTDCSGACVNFDGTQLTKAKFVYSEQLEPGAGNRMHFTNCLMQNAYFENLMPITAFNFTNTYSNGEADFRAYNESAFRKMSIPEHWLHSGLDLNVVFADGSVEIPSNSVQPKFWPKKTLSDRTFETEWRKWQSDPTTYTPP